MNENTIKLNDKQQKVIDWLTQTEHYQAFTSPTHGSQLLLKKYGVEQLVVNFGEPQKNKLDFEVQINGGVILFFIRVQNYLLREFKKFYQNADEVKKVLESLKERRLAELSELGYNDYFKKWIEILLTEPLMKEIALKITNKEIDLDNYSNGRSKQIEVLLTNGKRFDELKQSDYSNYQAYNDTLKELKQKKKTILELKEAVDKDWYLLEQRQSSGKYDWLNEEERKKNIFQILQNEEATIEKLALQLAQEYYDTLPKTTQLKVKDISEGILYRLKNWEGRIISEAKKTWTLEQWKKYKPNKEYDPYTYGDKEYNQGKVSSLQLQKISKSKNYSDGEINKFYQQIVEQSAKTFEPYKSYDSCWHCSEADDKKLGKPNFKLILKTKWRLIYTCSRCENSEVFFDIAEWKKEK